jgi:hypothetical protein
MQSFLEDILQAARRRWEQAIVEQSISRYYSSLNGSETAELADWAEFASREFPGEP